MQTLQPDVN